MEHTSHDGTTLAVHIERGSGVTEKRGRDAGEERTLGRNSIHRHVLELVEAARIMSGVEVALEGKGGSRNTLFQVLESGPVTC